ncbi:MAG: response regulator [Bacteroidetes bacterium]|nr:response regulator [Bacteroidota bacterium]
MEIYNLIASWLGWPIVVALLLFAGGYGYWLLKNRIDGVKENNDYLKMKLSYADKLSPDFLVERLASRLNIISEELERLHSDDKNNRERITELQTERNEIANDLVHFSRQILQSFLFDIEYLKSNAESGNIRDIQNYLENMHKNIVKIGDSLKSNITTERQTLISNDHVVSLYGKNILVVEDDQVILDKYANFLSACGVEHINKARCIEEALNLLNDSKQRFDLILLDMMLPNTKKDLEAVMAGQIQIDEIRSIFEDAEETHETLHGTQILSYQSKYATVRDNMNSFIKEDGGLLLLERLHSKNVKIPPVLFLTAVGNKWFMDRGRELVENNLYWLVKPVSREIILDKINEILLEKQSE